MRRAGGMWSFSDKTASVRRRSLRFIRDEREVSGGLVGQLLKNVKKKQSQGLLFSYHMIDRGEQHPRGY
jgi:hypothetical protein